MKPCAMRIRRGPAKRGRPVVGLFDTGSDCTLLKEGEALSLARSELPAPIPLGGIGGGRATAREMAVFQVKVLGRWCLCHAMLVPGDAMDVDLLLGEGFLFQYGLRIDVRRNAVVPEYPEHFRRMASGTLFVHSPIGKRGRGTRRK
ncbi:MAG: hypothetical protein HY720_14755 [Planctomycetes bacterium]|nr:hypothetical protein [Planctomycetota bacterium]